MRGVAALLALTLIGMAGVDARDEPLGGWFDLPVPGGAATLDAIGMTPDERAFTLPVLARALAERDQRILTESRIATLLADLSASPPDDGDVLTIPAPLDADAWRDLLPPPAAPAPRDLFLRLLTDRQALLLAAGLTATDPSVRALVSRDRDLLRFLYRQGTGAFVVAARHLRLDDDGVVLPGAHGAEQVWQTLAGESPRRPAAFVRALLAKDHGRLAWYFDTLASLDAAQLAAVWPDTTEGPPPALALYGMFRDSDAQWRVSDQPFRRGVNDAAAVLQRLAVESGVVSSPLPRASWELLFRSSRISASQAARTLADPHESVTIDWLAPQIMSPVVRERRFRFESVRLAQRVFATAHADELGDVMIAISGLRQHRALLFTLERMQIREPRTWAAAVLAAHHASNNADNHRTAVPAYQGALALLERMRHVRTLDAETATRLVQSLADAVRSDRQVSRSIATWIVEVLAPGIPPLVKPDAWTGRTAYESTILQALAGPAERSVPTLEWEGLSYAVDVVGAEHSRLRAMRALLPSPGLDAALAAGQPRDLVDALTVLVYATALGDPNGPASLSPDVVSRHEYGLTGTAVVREDVPWAPPEERHGLGPWHVQGSLLGLDLGLSRLQMRRLADQQMPQAPTLTLNDLATLTRTAVLLVPADLTDETRDEIAAALARGRQRVAAAETLADIDALVTACRMSGPARQLVPWIASRQPEMIPALFGLRDLLWLGRPRVAPADLHAWGAAADALDGRRVLAMPPPAPWEDYAGRAEAGQLTTQLPDVTLRLVEETAALELPAALVPPLLAYALGDYWHDVRLRFADDWLRLTRQAASIPSARIHDYVAALAGDGPLRTHR